MLDASAGLEQGSRRHGAKAASGLLRAAYGVALVIIVAAVVWRALLLRDVQDDE